MGSCTIYILILPDNTVIVEKPMYENERDMPLKSVLETASGNGKPKSLGFFIGPEGGFEPEEVASFSLAGIPAVTLGKRILRTETAGCAVLTAVMYAFGELS